MEGPAPLSKLGVGACNVRSIVARLLAKRPIRVCGRNASNDRGPSRRLLPRTAQLGDPLGRLFLSLGVNLVGRDLGVEFERAGGLVQFMIVDASSA